MMANDTTIFINVKRSYDKRYYENSSIYENEREHQLFGLSQLLSNLDRQMTNKASRNSRKADSMLDIFLMYVFDEQVLSTNTVLDSRRFVRNVCTVILAILLSQIRPEI